MKTRVTIIGVLAISIFCTTTCFMFYGRKGNAQPQKISAEELKKFERTQILVRQIYIYDQQKLDNPIVCFGSDTTWKTSYSEVAGKRRMVLAFSGNMCDPCISFAIQKLRENFEDHFYSDAVILFGTDMEERMKQNYFGKMVLSPLIDTTPPISVKVPSFYILDSTMTAKHFFIPDSFVPELTDIYLHAIRERYFPLSKGN